MNARSGPERNEADGRTTGRKPLSRLIEPAVPRQPRRAVPDRAGAGVQTSRPAQPDPLAAADPLEQADPAAVADAAATENLLRCWVRENDLRRPVDGTLRIRLDSTGATVCVPVRHWSATGWHRFGQPVLDGVPADAAPVDAVLLAALLAREGTHHAARTGEAPVAESAELIARVADSTRRTAEFVVHRRTVAEGPHGDEPFLDSEQSLVLGHPVHPTPKSREELSPSEARAYSPELHGSFALHWMAADPSVLAADSAWHGEDGRGVPAARLAERLAGAEVAARLPDGLVPLPLHPWQAREVRQRPEVARLLDAGLLHDLGPCGDVWYPTSSVRTVHRPGAPAMLKLSLGLRITNSRRENLRKELLRGVEVHRLLRTGLATRWHQAHPGFDIVRDPAWLGIDGPDGHPLPGLDTVIRHNPFGPKDRAVCIASLTALRPHPGSGQHRLRSQLADVVELLAERADRSTAAVSAEWFLRYLDCVVRPVLWFDAHAGIALEAHQQNTLVLLDADGWPCGGRFRDNQGYYFRTSRREEIQRRLPGAGLSSDSFVADEVTDERFAYYLGINNVFGLIGAFGSQRLADEELLLAAFRGFLGDAGTAVNGSPVSPFPCLLLGSPTLRCKANLLTRLHGMDELVGPVDTQSVYVTVTNPLLR